MDETDRRIAAYLRSQVAAVRTPPLPEALRRLAEHRPATATAAAAAVAFAPRRGVSIFHLAGAAAAIALCFLLPLDSGYNSVDRGVARLIQDAELHASVSGSIAAAAMAIGESLAKE